MCQLGLHSQQQRGLVSHSPQVSAPGRGSVDYLGEATSGLQQEDGSNLVEKRAGGERLEDLPQKGKFP